MKIALPSSDTPNIKNLALNYSGIIATDSPLDKSVTKRLEFSTLKLTIFIITATAEVQCVGLLVEIHLLSKEQFTIEEERLVRNLGKDQTACLRNGETDPSWSRRPSSPSHS